MYAFVDRRIIDLDLGSRILIGSMRQWVVAMRARRCAVDAIAGTFAKWGAMRGLQPFLRMMATLNRHGLENFEFGPPSCMHVSEHEAIVVQLVVALHSQRAEAVRHTLALILEEDAIGPMLIALTRLDEAFVSAGLFPVPPDSAGGPRSALGPV